MVYRLSFIVPSNVFILSIVPTFFIKCADPYHELYWKVDKTNEPVRLVEKTDNPSVFQAVVDDGEKSFSILTATAQPAIIFADKP